ncbi:thioredoxin family protein [Companilactobacillus halodurans]|uniref:Thioredoxin family protein n=1 Tax=Companilactobacillus halodurans TaxID=2584183 RepID=A0A5P0ZRX7_9LACO|nr:thioredoxin family protein [Companilactobacillus halodurans]MQS76952.1 thioredoxin family protein [Companilactobacillus halodurans]MQS97086.1 thioredoxin family protein [Companilactobacillus halodurans]
MKNIEDYNVKDWHEATKQGKFILFFHADWCPDCKFIEPKLPELEKEYSDFEWISFNRDNNMEVAQELGIMGIPSFVIIENGQEIGRLVNKDRKTKEEVETFINSVVNK